MKKFFLLFIFAPVLTFSDVKKLVIIGDSLTEGYGVSKDSTFTTVLQNIITASGKNWTVINSGIAGSTSASAPSRMKWILKSKPQMIILALGSNDALRGIKVEETKKNIDTAITLAKKNQTQIILAGLKAPPNYGEQYTRDFSMIFQVLAKKHQLHFIPFLLENVAGNKEFNLSDGIHPNEKGHEVIAQTILKSIRDLL